MAMADECELPTCAICFGGMDRGNSHRLHECGHVFHSECIIQWFRSKQDTCPLCRKLPNVRMKPPDVMHRAYSLMQKQKDGLIQDSVVAENMLLVGESESEIRRLEDKLKDLKKFNYNTLRVEKEKLLKEYRDHRKAFKAITVPILKRLDELDDARHSSEREIAIQLGAARSKRKRCLRTIGLRPVSD